MTSTVFSNIKLYSVIVEKKHTTHIHTQSTKSYFHKKSFIHKNYKKITKKLQKNYKKSHLIHLLITPFFHTLSFLYNNNNNLLSLPSLDTLHFLLKHPS